MNRIAVTIAIAALAISPSSALAQQDAAPQTSPMMMGAMAGCPMGAGEPGMMGRMMPGAMMGGGTMPGHMRGQLEDVDARLETLRAELGITADQQDVWDAYVAVADADAQSMAGMQASMTQFMQGQATAAPDWLAAHAGMMRARTDSLETLATAVEALYAELDDAQKATFDRYGGGLCGAW